MNREREAPNVPSAGAFSLVKNAAPDSHIVKHMYALRVLTGTHVLHCRVREEVREEEGEEEEESEGGNRRRE